MGSIAATRLMHFGNHTLKGVYGAHKEHKLRVGAKAFILDATAQSLYHVGIHVAINTMYKALYYIALMWQEDIMHGSTKNLLTLKDFADEVRKTKPCPITENSLQLCDVIDHTNYLYQSGNMFYGFNMFGENFPTVLAVGPGGEHGIVVHNHSLGQLIAAFNDFIKEINFFSGGEE